MYNQASAIYTTAFHVMQIAVCVKSIEQSNGLNFRMTAEVTNGEKVVVGRRYREDLIEAINKLAKEVG